MNTTHTTNQKTRNAPALLLKNKEKIFKSVLTPEHWNVLVAQFLVISIIGFAIFGMVMATQHLTWDHVFELSWKMIVLVWGPIVICVPSLYVFSAIRGSRLTLVELIYLMVGALATTGIVMLALAPVSWFFTWTTDSIEFIRVMNGAVIALSLAFGLYFLAKGTGYIQKLRHEQGSPRTVADILLVWFILLLVVVIQMSQKLGPWYVTV